MELIQGVDVNFVMPCMLPGHVSKGPFHSYGVRRHLVNRARNDVLHTQKRDVIFDLPRPLPPKVPDKTTSKYSPPWGPNGNLVPRAFPLKNGWGAAPIF